MQQFGIVPYYGTKITVAQAPPALRDGIEDGLNVYRRATDHAQDLARRRLLLEGFDNLSMSLCKREVLFLQLGKEADVLNGDYGLVGEGLQQLDLPLGEQACLGAPEEDHPDCLICAKEWYTEHRASTVAPREVATLGKLVRYGLQIGDVDRTPLEHHAATKNAPDQGNGDLADRAGGRDGTFVGDQA
jgi:hypothetical protein